MDSEDYIRDGLGWIDDFRTPPGLCGSPIARKIYIHALLNSGKSISQIKQMGFPKEFVTEVLKMIVEQEYVNESR
jgi:hypothetical protein